MPLYEMCGKMNDQLQLDPNGTPYGLCLFADYNYAEKIMEYHRGISGCNDCFEIRTVLSVLPPENGTRYTQNTRIVDRIMRQYEGSSLYASLMLYKMDVMQVKIFSLLQSIGNLNIGEESIPVYEEIGTIQPLPNPLMLNLSPIPPNPFLSTIERQVLVLNQNP